MVVNIRDNKSTIRECVDHVSGLFVDLDSVKVSRFSGEINSAGISRELSYPSELNPEFVED